MTTKIMIVSDAWHPQINGVVRTLEATAKVLRDRGYQVLIHGPDERLWNTVSLPWYPSIKLEFRGRARFEKIFNEMRPDYLHIATEGPLGWTARNFCINNNYPFTTSYHTRFPEYLASRAPPFLKNVVIKGTYQLVRLFHRLSRAVMVSTLSTENDLRSQGIEHLVRWSRGVDTHLFCPSDEPPNVYLNLKRPVLLNVGRVAIEKNLSAFLQIRTPGTKVIIGDGPAQRQLCRQFPDAVFLGTLEGVDLARHYANADLFVFPSETETFGLVLLEAATCGLRIASYPAPGPRDLLSSEETKSFAVLDANLTLAIQQALELIPDAESARDFAERFSWETCTDWFCAHLEAGGTVFSECAPSVAARPQS